MSEISLEIALEELANSSENAEEFLDNYKSTKRYLNNNMYPWVQANCSWFTDHGEKHIDSVMYQASRLLENEIREPGQGDIDELDIFILLMAILWHDVGMIAHRAEHERISTEVSEQFSRIAYPNTSIKRVVEDVVKAHRKQTGLDIPQKDTSFTLSGKVYKIYPKALAGIVRFADEISETQERVSGDNWVVNQVPDESKIFWRYAQSIQACYPDLNGQSIQMNIELSQERATERNPCPESIEDKADEENTISVIEYIICRLEKLANELAYCERYFNRYVEIRGVEVALTVRDQNQDIIDEIDIELGATGLTSKETYPNVSIYEDFFDQHTEWKPEVLGETTTIEGTNDS